MDEWQCCSLFWGLLVFTIHPHALKAQLGPGIFGFYPAQPSLYITNPDVGGVGACLIPKCSCCGDM